MNCPACEHELTNWTVEELSVDVCEGGCGGIWFDQLQLQKVDEAHEHAGEALVDVPRKDGIEVDHERRRTCPRCVGQIMRRFFYSPKRQVEIDECPACAGVWLDAGELQYIRTKYPTEEERKKAANAYFAEMFGERLEALRQESEERAQRASRFARLFRWLLPSYWIPGNQRWGAF